jgi:competence ComEA-like helix-hairpin-helix protein
MFVKVSPGHQIGIHGRWCCVECSKWEKHKVGLFECGLSRANAIVARRKNYGPLYSAEELSAVRGIGMTTIEKNAGKIVVE